MRHVALAAACSTVLAGCGGEGADSGPALEWVRTPKVVDARTADAARILQGEVRNRGDRELRIEATDVELRAADGARVPGSAIFLSGYVRPGEPQNRGGAPFAETEAARIGRVVRIAPGMSAPLVVSWRVRDGRPAEVAYPGGSLRVSP